MVTKQRKLPEEILINLEKQFGISLISEPSGDFLGPGVFLLFGGELNLMAKRNPHKRESSFYTHIAPKINSKNAKTPKLIWNGNADNAHWIVIESSKCSLPECRWEADQKVIKYLAAIHQTSVEQKVLSAYMPEWTEDMNKNALGFFHGQRRQQIAPLLKSLCESSQHLFSRECLIIGNSNPKNIGLMKDGSVMAQDWSKVGYASPAIDLAISICTSETWQTSLKASTFYMQENQLPGHTNESLAQDILKGCVWNYIVFLNKIRHKKIEVPDVLVEHILDIFPEWLEQTATAA